MKHNLNIDKLKLNSQSTLRKICFVTQSSVSENTYTVYFDFKRLPTGLYGLIKNLMDIEIEMFGSDLNVANKRVKFIVASTEIQFDNYFKSIYSDFFKKMSLKLTELFTGSNQDNVLTGGNVYGGTKNLSCSTSFNIATNPELRKYIENEYSFLKSFEDIYLKFLNDLEKVSYQPLITNKIVLKNKDSDLFKLTIDCLIDKIHMNLKVEEDLFSLPAVEILRKNIEIIEQNVNKEYSKDNCKFGAINEMCFDLISISRSVYGFMNALNFALHDFFKEDHDMAKIQPEENSTYVFICNDYKNDLQIKYLDRRVIFIGTGAFSLKNFIRISKQIQGESAGSQNLFLTKLLSNLKTYF